MFLIVILFIVTLVYYLNFRRSRKSLYELSNSLPNAGCLPILGHAHWFIGGPENKLLRSCISCSSRVLAKTSKTSPNTTGLSCLVQEFLWPPSDSIIRSAPWYHIIALSRDINIRAQTRRVYLVEYRSSYGHLPTPSSDQLYGTILLHCHRPLTEILNNIKTLADMVDKAGGISKVWLGPSLYVVTLKPEDIQTILEDCLEKDASYKFLQTWLGNGLFVAPVELWKTHRRLLLPIFRNRVIEDYIDVFGEQGVVLVKRLRENQGKPMFDVYKYITSCMLDIVFETAMGEKMDVQYNSDTPYLRARSWVISIIGMRFFKVWMQPDFLFNISQYSKIQAESISLTHKFTDEVVMRKRKMVEKYAETARFREGRKDLLELLLAKKMNFTNEELREHIDSITIAGNDTTALVISYALLLLGCHNDVQDKVYEEIISIFGDSLRSPTKEDINKMDYLERVIKETMRLYTVVPIIGRKTQSEIKLSTCTLPAGVGCAILPFVIHRLKSIWGSDADDFNPDRFLPENCAKRHPCSFIPFSFGSRNCIGRHFGMLAMKSILATVLRSYKITSNECKKLKIEVLLFPVDGHLISIEKRV